MTNLRTILQEGRSVLEAAHIDDAATDAWLLLEYCYGVTRTEYLMKSEVEQDDVALKERYLEMVRLRAEHIPLQHLTGQQEFMGLKFLVNEHVLIPRQDTELLVEKAMEVIQSMENPEDVEVLDMCTGSGCIIISLQKLLCLKGAIAVDVSAAALEVAAKNAELNEASVRFVKSNLFENIEDRYDMIVSNPPYIETAEVETLMPEVRNHEPRLALDGDSDGLKFYREITESAVHHLKKNGFLLYEIGYNQAESVRNILRNNHFTEIEVFQDLAGKDRVIKAKFSGL